MQQPDLNQLLQSMQQTQDALAKLQNELTKMKVEGSAGGGAVKITCTGALDFTAVKIQPDAIDPSDTGMLEDLILTALKDACDKAKALGEQKMRSLPGMPPGLGL